MGMIWLIIKIILITLLILLALVVTMITIILIAPIRYEAYVARYSEVDYDIKIRYLKGIQAIFKQENDKKNHVIKVFGKVIYKNKIVEEESASEKNSEKVTQKAKTEKVTDEDKAEKLSNHEKIGETPQETVLTKKDKKLENSSKSDELMIKEEVVKEEIPKNKGQDLEVVKEVNPELKTEAKEVIKESVEEATEETIETIEKMSFDWLKRFIFDKTTYKCIKQIVKYTWYILKYIAPYEWDFEIIVGREDPADTGELLAGLMMFYHVYAKHGIIQGDFERACLEGGFLVRGKFKIGGILVYILRCILSKSVRQTIYLIYKLRKDEQEDGE